MAKHQFSAYSIAMEAPPEWFERSITWVANNTYTNISTRYYEGLLHRLIGDFQPDIPPPPINVVGGEDGDPIDWPAWWP